MNQKDQATALAIFCDDIRVEVTGKLFCIGVYTTNVHIRPEDIFDRVAVLITIKWPRALIPNFVGVKTQVTAQPEMPYQALQFQSLNMSTDKPISPFSGFKMKTFLQLRFPPLRVDDTIDVWVKVDDQEIPAGRIYIEKAPDLNQAVNAFVQRTASTSKTPSPAA